MAMDYPESAAQAVAYLKQALPKMVQHELAPNPINYSLWYNYVADRAPELKRAIDELIRNQGTYSTAQSQALFQRYLLSNDGAQHQKTAATLQALAAQLLSQLQDSTRGSREFDRELEQAALSLANCEQIADLEQITRTLAERIAALSEANRRFDERMQAAQNEIESLRAELQQSQRSADTDPLTQVCNRQAFDREIATLLKQDQGLCLVFCDIDHFKQFNDEYGHLMGDRVLQRVAALIRDGLPADGLAARFGGEEFALLLPTSTLAAAEQVAELVRRRIEQLRVKIRNSERVLDNISASFGVAIAQPGDTPETLIDRADQALYAAKRSGRNRVICATETSLPQAQQA
jgi:diguanylate cyclase